MNHPMPVAYMILVSVIALVGMVTPGSSLMASDELTAEKVREAIDGGVRFLKGQQNHNGSWNDVNRYRGGGTALALLALLNSGLPENDPAVRRGIQRLLELPQQNLSTYVVSLRIMVLAAADPAGRKYKLEMGRDARWLMERQVGLW